MAFAFLLFLLRKHKFSNSPISTGLIYKSPNSSLSLFTDCVRYLVDRTLDINLDI